MKNCIKLLFPLSLLVATAVGCGKTDTPKPELSLSSHELEFEYNEVRVDKTVEVTTNAATFEIDTEYGDPQNTGWLDAVREGNWVKVAVLSNNIDPEEEPRTATVTVTVGELSEVIEVTQLSYIETDFSIGLSADVLDFAPSGNYLTKELTATTKILPVVPDTDADWITFDVEGKTIRVTVEENTGDERSAVVSVTNGRGGEAGFTVHQYGQASVDIAGTWTWTSDSAISDTTDGWATAEEVSGEVAVELIEGGFVVKGIKGKGMLMTDLIAANPDLMPEMHLRLEENQLFVGMDLFMPAATVGPQIMFDPAFTVGTTSYYSAKSLHYEDMDTPNYKALDFPVTMTTEETGGVIHQTISFPTTYSNAPDAAGRTAAVSYIYYYYRYNARFQRADYYTVDPHRNVVLSRVVE